MMCCLKEADVRGAEVILKRFITSLNCATAFEEYLQANKKC